jgi:hypothetical protein
MVGEDDAAWTGPTTGGGPPTASGGTGSGAQSTGAAFGTDGSVAGTGGGASTGGAGDPGPAVGCAQIPAILAGCSASICHTNSRREGDLSLEYADPYGAAIASELLNARAAYNVPDRSSCPPERELRVDASNLDQSLLLKKLDGRYSCGDPMPGVVGLAEWSPENRTASYACVREWLRKLVDDNAP